MWEIEYEEIDSKEKIYRELNNMTTEKDPKNIDTSPKIEPECLLKFNETVQNDFKTIIGDDINSNIIFNNTTDCSGEEFSNNLKMNNSEDTCCVSENVECEGISIKEERSETTKEVTTPKRISELYSQFNASWKDRLKVKTFKEETISSMINNCEESADSDFQISDNEMMPDISINKPICVDSSCNSLSDEQFSALNGKKKPLRGKITSSKKSLFVDSSCNSAADEIVFGSSKKSKTTACASFGCDFKADEEICVKKPLNVGSSCCSTSDATMVRPELEGVKIATTSTGTDCADTNQKSESTFSTQIDETYNSLEQKILPFVKSPHTVELRLKGRLSVFQRACVKQIATQHKLLIKYFGKGKDGYVLLRKKVELVTAQKLFLEMKKNEIERKKEKVAQDKAKMERLLNPPKKVSSGCQVDIPDPKEQPTEISKKEARKNRKKEWELKQKQLAKRNSSTQTVEKGFYLCPYCEADIPESHQSIHYPFCLSKYRSQMQLASKSANGVKDKKNVGNRSMRPISGERKHRSKSRDKMHSSTLDVLRKELDKIHSNDINAMVNVLNELDKRCSVSGCNKKKQKTCEDCTVGYCNGHYSPEGVTGTGHFNCPVALERAETERQKRLGSNNPLMKTIEELSAPRFPDGALLKRPRRVRVVDPVPLLEESSVVGNASAGAVSSTNNIAPPNINETRTRNGSMLGFERNALKNKLREKLGHFTDRRTK